MDGDLDMDQLQSHHLCQEMITKLIGLKGTKTNDFRKNCPRNEKRQTAAELCQAQGKLKLAWL